MIVAIGFRYYTMGLPTWAYNDMLLGCCLADCLSFSTAAGTFARKVRPFLAEERYNDAAAAAATSAEKFMEAVQCFAAEGKCGIASSLKRSVAASADSSSDAAARANQNHAHMGENLLAYMSL